MGSILGAVGRLSLCPWAEAGFSREWQSFDPLLALIESCAAREDGPERSVTFVAYSVCFAQAAAALRRVDWPGVSALPALPHGFVRGLFG